MAQKLGVLEQWLFGEWADRASINRNAEDLSLVEADLGTLKTIVQRQAQEILRLRAMFMGVVEVLREMAPFDDAKLERAMQMAWTQLTTPPARPQPDPPRPSAPEPRASDPYRSLPPSEPSPADIQAAKALMVTAQDHHFNRRFRDARAIYQQIVDRHGTTKQAMLARQQLENLRNV